MAKVMIVDDAAFMRMMLRTILEKNGHEVICEAANGVEAIDKYVCYRPDLVTMDITMPVMEGVEAVQLIVKQDPLAKIMMCSAMGQQHSVLEAFKAGAKDFIVKPFHESRVIETLNKMLAR